MRFLLRLLSLSCGFSVKIEDFGLPNPSQNPSKILSKSMSQKTCDFSSIFVRKMLCCQNADIDSVLVFTIQNGSRTFFFKLLFAWIWGPKNHPKTSQKPCPGDPKIDLENVLFFNIDFFAFWPRFWSLLGALGTLLGPFGRLLGTSWVSLSRSWMPPGCHMLPERYPGSILEGSGCVRGGFWRFPNSIFRGFSIHFVIMFLIVQSPRFCISQRFVFFPSGAAVCAQHLESAAPLSVPRRVKSICFIYSYKNLL